MEGDKPAGGEWNYDAENRKAAAARPVHAAPAGFAPDSDHAQRSWRWWRAASAITSAISNPSGSPSPAPMREAAFAAFVSSALPRFGDYQDAMLEGEPFLYHAVIAQYLNCGLLDPLEVCRAVEAAMAGGPCAAQCSGRLHPPDHRLARICARHLLADRMPATSGATSSSTRARCPHSTGPPRPTWPASAPPSCRRASTPMPTISSA
jgi:hypothetical protein